MKDMGSRVAPLAAAALAGALGGYFLGFAGARSASRTTEAAADLLVPATDFRVDRIRHDAIRGELKRMMDLQLGFLADSGAFATDEAVLQGTQGFILRTLQRPKRRPTLEGRKTEVGWIATLSHEESPDREACAVALGVESAYGGGIPLRRPGRIRCSWDLATRLNLLW